MFSKWAESFRKSLLKETLYIHVILTHTCTLTNVHTHTHTHKHAHTLHIHVHTFRTHTYINTISTDQITDSVKVCGDVSKVFYDYSIVLHH